MWPQQTQHQHYRVGEMSDSQQHRNPRNLMHSTMGLPAPSSVVRLSTDSSIVTGQHRQHQSMHPHQQQHQYSHSYNQQQQQQQQQEQQQQHCDNAILLTGSSNPRASRNMAEKQRRDNLNTNISTMATLVPTVAGSSRRLDKISILRLAAAYLRTQYTLGTGISGFLPHRFNDFDLEQYFIDNLVGNDGFILVVTTAGKIVYVSRQIEQHLGHAQSDLFGQSLYNFIYPEDHEELTENLTPDELTNHLMITESSGTDENSSSSEASSIPRNNESQLSEHRRSFNVRMSQRTVSRREHTQYECLHITGILRPAMACRNVVSAGDRATRHRELNSTGNDVVFVGTARLMKKRITELSLLEANKEEYVTRHLVDGRIIFCDHRISVVAGYMTDEVAGMSGFSYMHADDVMWTVIALRQMYHRGEGFGSSCYRLKTKTGEYIYLRTHAYVEVDKARQSFESFICVNTSVSKEEGEKLTNEMKARYSATISSTDTLFACESMKALGSDSQRTTPKVVMEDPLQLENAISHLINDFASPTISEDRLSQSPLPDTQTIKAALISQHLPPPSIHANKIGIKNIDLVIPSVGKDKLQTIKREASVDTLPSKNTTSPHDNSDNFEEQSRVKTGKTSPKVRRGDKIIPEINGNREEQFSSPDKMPNLRYASRGKDYCKIEAISSSASSSSSCESMNREMPESPLCQSPGTSTMFAPHRGKPENMLVYVKTEKPDNEQVEMTERNTGFTIKRSCAEECVTLSNKKRRGVNSRGNVNAIVKVDSSSPRYDGKVHRAPFVDYTKERTTSPSAVQCKIEKLHVSTGNGKIQRDNDSPCSSLHDFPNVDYPPLNSLNPSNFGLSVFDDEQLDHFPDLQIDPLLSPGLDDNPESLDDETMQQFSTSEQAVSEGLRRTHIQLANRMTMQKTQLCVLEHELETPALQSRFFEPSRETLIELQAEHEKNARMLKTIQHDQHNMNVKQNAGV